MSEKSTAKSESRHDPKACKATHREFLRGSHFAFFIVNQGFPYNRQYYFH
jgi:hypothetical protein